MVCGVHYNHVTGTIGQETMMGSPLSRSSSRMEFSCLWRLSLWIPGVIKHHETGDDDVISSLQFHLWLLNWSRAERERLVLLALTSCCV